MTAFPAILAAGAACHGWPLLVSATRWTDPLLFCGWILLAALLGLFVGLLVGWPIIGPLYYDRSRKNGEPFQRGDMVQILVGPYSDRIAPVTDAFDIASFAGGHRVRVDLGADAKGCGNVFRSHQVLRISSGGQAET